MSRLPDIDLRQLSEPVSLRRRVLDVACVVAGVVLVYVALTRGGETLLLLAPGLGLIAVGVFLLSRRRRLAEPATMVGWFQEALDDRYGGEATSAEARAARVVMFQQAAAKLAELGAGEPGWAVIGGTGEFAGRVMFVELASRPEQKRLCLLVPERPGLPGFFLDVPTLEERRRAEAAFEGCEKAAPGMWRVDCTSYEETAAEVERAFSQVFQLPSDYSLRHTLRRTQPAWVLGVAPHR